MLQFADTPPALVATTTARAKATSIATAFAIPAYIRMCELVVDGNESTRALAQYLYTTKVDIPKVV
jgi:hypothetical protein